MAALHPLLLDRKRPLWKFHVFEGLAPSAHGHKRVAMYSQLHHAAVDGQAAVALANAILDVTPEPRAIETAGRRSARRRFASTWARCCAARWPTRSQQVSNIVKELPTTVGTLGGAAGTVLKSGLANSVLFGGKGGAGNVTLAPKHAVQRVGHHRPRLCRAVAAAGRAEGARQGARRHASTTWC